MYVVNNTLLMNSNFFIVIILAVKISESTTEYFIKQDTADSRL